MARDEEATGSPSSSSAGGAGGGGGGGGEEGEKSESSEEKKKDGGDEEDGDGEPKVNVNELAERAFAIMARGAEKEKAGGARRLSFEQFCAWLDQHPRVLAWLEERMPIAASVRGKKRKSSAVAPGSPPIRARSKSISLSDSSGKSGRGGRSGSIESVGRTLEEGKEKEGGERKGRRRSHSLAEPSAPIAAALSGTSGAPLPTPPISAAPPIPPEPTTTTTTTTTTTMMMMQQTTTTTFSTTSPAGAIASGAKSAPPPKVPKEMSQELQHAMAKLYGCLAGLRCSTCSLVVRACPITGVQLVLGDGAVEWDFEANGWRVNAGAMRRVAASSRAPPRRVDQHGLQITMFTRTVVTGGGGSRGSGRGDGAQSPPRTPPRSGVAMPAGNSWDLTFGSGGGGMGGGGFGGGGGSVFDTASVAGKSMILSKTLELFPGSGVVGGASGSVLESGMMIGGYDGEGAVEGTLESGGGRHGGKHGRRRRNRRRHHGHHGHGRGHGHGHHGHGHGRGHRAHGGRGHHHHHHHNHHHHHSSGHHHHHRPHSHHHHTKKHHHASRHRPHSHHHGEERRLQQNTDRQGGVAVLASMTPSRRSFLERSRAQVEVDSVSSHSSGATSSPSTLKEASNRDMESSNPGTSIRRSPDHEIVDEGTKDVEDGPVGLEATGAEEGRDGGEEKVKRRRSRKKRKGRKRKKSSRKDSDVKDEEGEGGDGGGKDGDAGMVVPEGTEIVDGKEEDGTGKGGKRKRKKKASGEKLQRKWLAKVRGGKGAGRQDAKEMVEAHGRKHGRRHHHHHHRHPHASVHDGTARFTRPRALSDSAPKPMRRKRSLERHRPYEAADVKEPRTPSKASPPAVPGPHSAPRPILQSSSTGDLAAMASTQELQDTFFKPRDSESSKPLSVKSPISTSSASSSSSSSSYTSSSSRSRSTSRTRSSSRSSRTSSGSSISGSRSSSTGMSSSRSLSRSSASSRSESIQTHSTSDRSVSIASVYRGGQDSGSAEEEVRGMVDEDMLVGSVMGVSTVWNGKTDGDEADEVEIGDDMAARGKAMVRRSRKSSNSQNSFPTATATVERSPRRHPGVPHSGAAHGTPARGGPILMPTSPDGAGGIPPPQGLRRASSTPIHSPGGEHHHHHRAHGPGPRPGPGPGPGPGKLVHKVSMETAAAKLESHEIAAGQIRRESRKSEDARDSPADGRRSSRKMRSKTSPTDGDEGALSITGSAFLSVSDVSSISGRWRRKARRKDRLRRAQDASRGDDGEGNAEDPAGSEGGRKKRGKGKEDRKSRKHGRDKRGSSGDADDKKMEKKRRKSSKDGSSSGWDPSVGTGWVQGGGKRRELSDEMPSFQRPASEALYPRFGQGLDIPKLDLPPKTKGEQSAIGWKGESGGGRPLRSGSDEGPKTLEYTMSHPPLSGLHSSASGAVEPSPAGFAAPSLTYGPAGSLSPRRGSSTARGNTVGATAPGLGGMSSAASSVGYSGVIHIPGHAHDPALWDGTPRGPVAATGAAMMRNRAAQGISPTSRRHPPIKGHLSPILQGATAPDATSSLLPPDLSLDGSATSQPLRTGTSSATSGPPPSTIPDGPFTVLCFCPGCGAKRSPTDLVAVYKTTLSPVVAPQVSPSGAGSGQDGGLTSLTLPPAPPTSQVHGRSFFPDRNSPRRGQPKPGMSPKGHGHDTGPLLPSLVRLRSGEKATKDLSPVPEGSREKRGLSRHDTNSDEGDRSRTGRPKPAGVGGLYPSPSPPAASGTTSTDLPSSTRRKPSASPSTPNMRLRSNSSPTPAGMHRVDSGNLSQPGTNSSGPQPSPAASSGVDAGISGRPRARTWSGEWAPGRPEPAEREVVTMMMRRDADRSGAEVIGLDIYEPDKRGDGDDGEGGDERGVEEAGRKHDDDGGGGGGGGGGGFGDGKVRGGPLPLPRSPSPTVDRLEIVDAGAPSPGSPGRLDEELERRKVRKEKSRKERGDSQHRGLKPKGPDEPFRLSTGPVSENASVRSDAGSKRTPESDDEHDSNLSVHSHHSAPPLTTAALDSLLRSDPLSTSSSPVTQGKRDDSDTASLPGAPPPSPSSAYGASSRRFLAPGTASAIPPTSSSHLRVHGQRFGHGRLQFQADTNASLMAQKSTVLAKGRAGSGRPLPLSARQALLRRTLARKPLALTEIAESADENTPGTPLDGDEPHETHPFASRSAVHTTRGKDAERFFRDEKEEKRSDSVLALRPSSSEIGQTEKSSSAKGVLGTPALPLMETGGSERTDPNDIPADGTMLPPPTTLARKVSSPPRTPLSPKRFPPPIPGLSIDPTLTTVDPAAVVRSPGAGGTPEEIFHSLPSAMPPPTPPSPSGRSAPLAEPAAPPHDESKSTSSKPLEGAKGRATEGGVVRDATDGRPRGSTSMSSGRDSDSRRAVESEYDDEDVEVDSKGAPIEEAPEEEEDSEEEVQILEGHLWKRGRRIGLMHKRYYVLRDNFLFVYNTESERRSETQGGRGLGRPFECHFLEGAYVRASADEGAAAAFGYYGLEIVLHTSMDDGKGDGGSALETSSTMAVDEDSAAQRPFRLYARSKSERNRWLEALRRVCRAVPFEEEYEVGRELGRGRFSRVMEARHRTSARKVAVKVVDKNSLRHEEKDLLRTELAILRIVRHPRIIRLEGVHETGRKLLIVTELVQGGELFDRIVGRSRFSEDEARRLARPLIEAIDYLHGLGIVHRDIKPENILTDTSLFDIKIADFGLSVMVRPGQELTTPCGTLSYVAPEVLDMRGYGKAVDMWSVGVILYLVVRGKLPFDGKTKEDVIRKTLNANVDFSHTVWRRWSSDGVDFIRKLLERDPLLRLTTQQALRHRWMKSDGSSGGGNGSGKDDKGPAKGGGGGGGGGGGEEGGGGEGK